METFYRTGMAIALVAGLSACGGEATTPTTVPSFSETFGVARTEPFSVGSSIANASGTYRGTAQLSIASSGQDETFLGNATMTVDIAGGNVSGTLDSFDDATGDLQGAITLTAQSFGVAQASEFTATASGSLTSATTSIALGSGTVFGDLHNNPTSGLTASGAFSNTTLNGTSGLSSVLDIQATKN